MSSSSSSSSGEDSNLPGLTEDFRRHFHNSAYVKSMVNQILDDSYLQLSYGKSLEPEFMQALEAARATGTEVLIIDTAGRLQNRSELMDELAKIVRVVRKLDETAPHDSVIVLDGTVGQNALSQVSAFREVADVSGLIVTKLDGSAKGGIVIALAEQFGLPVHAVGVGEGADDLQPFEARDFANALAGVADE